ncbi:MAG: hypothetical protein NUV61_02010 [Candidatus Azambacteria bacterium]|nr:hypothetical protein [Candidatus Azambacteria bacterium]
MNTTEIFQLLIFLVIFIGGFLAGKNYGETVTTAKMGDAVIKSYLESQK